MFFVPNLLTSDGLFVINEEPFAEFVRKLARVHPNMRREVTGSPEEVVSLLIEHYNLMAVVSYEGEVSAYCRRMRNRMPTVAQRALANNLGVYVTTPVGWFPSLNSDPTETTGAVVFYGEAPKKSPKAKKPKPETHAQLRQRFWAKNQTELPTLDDVDKLVGGGY